MPLMLENARLSLETEPGCLRFDVSTDPMKAHRVFLYEIYASRGAFDEHLRTDHFLAFDREVASMVESKVVSLLELMQLDFAS